VGIVLPAGARRLEDGLALGGVTSSPSMRIEIFFCGKVSDFSFT
jgi:hypothetical protein